MNEQMKQLMLQAGYTDPQNEVKAQKLVQLLINQCSAIAMTHHFSTSPANHEELEEYDKGCDDTASIISGEIITYFNH